jgi:hypothetical protein
MKQNSWKVRNYPSYSKLPSSTVIACICFCLEVVAKLISLRIIAKPADSDTELSICKSSPTKHMQVESS